MTMLDYDDEKPVNSFAIAKAPSAGGALAAMEKREETEVFAMVMMAKRFPRDQQACMERILTAFQRHTLAEVAQYQYARGGTDIVGPSIRAAEAIAQEWGSLDTGWRELARGMGHNNVPFSEVLAYCYDLQSTTRKAITFIVPHWRDTKTGGYKLKDERDIYELCANQAQRRLRACIIANIPGDVMDQAMRQATATLKAKADVTPEAQARLLEAFGAFHVTKEHIEARLQRRLDSISPAQMVGMKRIYASLRDEMSTPGDWFPDWKAPAGAEPPAPPAPTPEPTLSDLVAERSKMTPEPTPAPTPAPAGAPPYSFEELKTKMEKAKTLEALDTWADNIRAFKDEAQLALLQDVYEAMKAKINGALAKEAKPAK
jgi:hypothetical protein